MSGDFDPVADVDESALPTEAGLSRSEPPDPQLRQLLAVQRASGEPPFHLSGVDDARARAQRLRSHQPPGAAMRIVDDLEVPAAHGGIPIRHYCPLRSASDVVVVYFHGGGWVVGGLDESDGLCRALADASGCEVVSVAYRLAPEHPFPAAVDDAEAATSWVAENLAQSGRLVLVGDSAGGNLAAVVCRRARDRGGPSIALQVLIYPVTDHRMTSGSYEEHGGQLLISAEDMRWFWSLYAPSGDVRASIDASPVLAPDLTGLPPALVVVAEYDPLRDEALAYAHRLEEAGVAVTVDRYEAMIHGFVALVGLVDTASTVVDSIARAIASIPDAA